MSGEVSTRGLLSENLIKSFRCGRALATPSTAQVNSLDFFEGGDYFATSSDDKTIRLYSSSAGSAAKTYNVSKTGVTCLKFTHHAAAVICAAQTDSDWEESIRYLSLHDNRDLRYFRGHRARVIGLEMCPFEDVFASSSLDNTVRLWDLRSPLCQAVISLPSLPLHHLLDDAQASSKTPLPPITPPPLLTAFDPEGLTLALVVPNTKGLNTASISHSPTISNNLIQLFDRRLTDTGPFKSFTIQPDISSLSPSISTSSSSLPSASPQPTSQDISLFTITSIAFSPDGATLIFGGAITLHTTRSPSAPSSSSITSSSSTSSTTPSVSSVSSTSSSSSVLGIVVICDAFTGSILKQIIIPSPNPSSTSSLTTASSSSLSSSSSTTTTLPSSSTPSTSTPSSPSSFITRPPVCFSVSPDASFITVGSLGTLTTYSLSTAEPISTWHQHRYGTSPPSSSSPTATSPSSSYSPVYHVKWNPSRAMVVSSDPTQLALWVPKPK